MYFIVASEVVVLQLIVGLLSLKHAVVGVQVGVAGGTRFHIIIVSDHSCVFWFPALSCIFHAGIVMLASQL